MKRSTTIRCRLCPMLLCVAVVLALGPAAAVRGGVKQRAVLSGGGTTDAVAFSPDGRMLASCGDGAIKLWDLGAADSEPVATPRPATPATPIKPADDGFRTWTSADGAFSIDAKLIDVSGDQVRLMGRTSKKVITVPLAKLSEADRALVKRIVEDAR